MRHTVLSRLKKIQIEIERFIDHAYRMVTGYPTLARSEITPEIFIGGQYHKRAVSTFRKLGITAIVNMRTRAQYTEGELEPLRTLHLATVDQTAPTIKQLQQGIVFIKKEIEKGGKVYIHCRFGEGRGPTMGIAYLISQGLTLTDAIDLVRQKRSFIRITPVQLQRLKEIEAHWMKN